MSKTQGNQQMQGGKGNNGGQIRRAPGKMEGRKPGNHHVKKAR